MKTVKIFLCLSVIFCQTIFLVQASSSSKNLADEMVEQFVEGLPPQQKAFIEVVRNHYEKLMADEGDPQILISNIQNWRLGILATQEEGILQEILKYNVLDALTVAWGWMEALQGRYKEVDDFSKTSTNPMVKHMSAKVKDNAIEQIALCQCLLDPEFLNGEYANCNFLDAIYQVYGERLQEDPAYEEKLVDDKNEAIREFVINELWPERKALIMQKFMEKKKKNKTRWFKKLVSSLISCFLGKTKEAVSN